MFLSTREILVKKVKEILAYLAFGIIFAGFVLLMFAIDGNDELRIGVLNDILTFGLAAFVGRAWYVYSVNRYNEEKQKRQARRQRKVAAKKVITPAPVAPISPVPAPVAKPVFFDFEAHE